MHEDYNMDTTETDLNRAFYISNFFGFWFY